LTLAGTGSGLAVVQSIVEFLEGDISVSDESGLKVVINFPEPLEREDF
jgi:signal transduction histidine kinase